MTAGSTALSERQETILALIIHEIIQHAEPVWSERLGQPAGLGRRRHREKWVPLAASVPAPHSRVASLVPAPRPDRTAFKHLELIATQSRQVLLVLVLEGGEVRQQMLTLAEPVDQSRLRQTAEQITRACAGQDASGVLAQAARFGGLGPGHPRPAGESAAGGGGEELRDYSMVLARYGAAGYATGALGVLGPTRMAYGRSISAVRYVAGLLSHLLLEAFAAWTRRTGEL